MRLARGSDDVRTSARSMLVGSLWIAAGFAVIALSGAVGARAAAALLLGGAAVHVVGEMISSGGQWGVSMGLAPMERQGQYQGFSSLGFALIGIVGPPLVTLLCVHGGRLGWAAMGGLILLAGLVAQPLSRWALANRAAYGVTTHSG